MDIKHLRNEIDAVDGELLELFRRRMELSPEIARLKKGQGLPIYDPAREQEKLAEIARRAGEDMGEYSEALWMKLMELSKAYQQSIKGEEENSSADSESGVI